MGGGNPFNIIRLMSYKIYDDVILTGTLNDTISSSSFNWNINNLDIYFQNNINNACFALGNSGGSEFYTYKNVTVTQYAPYGTRLIIEFKE